MSYCFRTCQESLGFRFDVCLCQPAAKCCRARRMAPPCRDSLRPAAAVPAPPGSPANPPVLDRRKPRLLQGLNDPAQGACPVISVSDLSLTFGLKPLFKEVNLKFNPGNCYGVIGANGAGKSTFLKILSGEIDNYSGEVTIPKNARLSVLGQNQFAFDDFSVIHAVIYGNR